MPADVCCQGHKIVFRCCLNYTMYALRHMHIVVVVPGWRRIDYFIAGVYYCPEDGIYKWSATRSDQDLVVAVINPFPVFQKGGNSISKLKYSIGWGIVCKMLF